MEDKIKFTSLVKLDLKKSLNPIKQNFVSVGMKRIAEKLDFLLWILAIPLIPMIFVEFSSGFSPQIQFYFRAYYLILWFIFTLEFAIKFFTAKDRVEYVKTNIIGFLVIFTPALRVLQVFNVLRFPLVLLSDRALKSISKFGMTFVYYAVFVCIVALAGADLIFYFERQSQLSDIHTFSDALWAAVNYLTTTGNSRNIATTGGRIVGIALMTIGFAVFSVLIALLASFFMEEYSKVSPGENLLEGVKDQLGLDEVMERLDRIEKKISEK